MKKLIYVILMVFVAIFFSGCDKNEWNKFISCTPEEKENIFCNYDLNPVCGDDWETYWNACIACISNNIDSYKMWECKICDDETGICSFWDIWENNFSIEWEISDQEVKEIFVEVPTPPDF